MTQASERGLHPAAKDFLDFYKDALAAVALAVAAIGFEHSPTFFAQGSFSFLSTSWVFGGIAMTALVYVIVSFWALVVAVNAKANGRCWKVAGLLISALTLAGVLAVIVAVLTAIAK